MQMFKDFFKKNNQDLGNLPNYDYNIEFLKQIINTPCSANPFDKNTYWLNRFLDLNVNVYQLIEFYTSNKYLRITFKEEEMTIPQLKLLLKENNISVTGNKETLVERVIKFVKYKEYQKNLRQYYKLTVKGKELIIDDSLRFRNEYALYFDKIFKLILNRKIKDAIFLENKFRALHVDQRSFGSGNNFNIDTQTLDIVNYFYDNPKLHYNNRFAESLISILTCYALTRSFKSDNYKNEVIKLIEKLDLTSFVDFHNNSFVSEKIIDSKKLIDDFLSFEYSYAYNFITFKSYNNEFSRKRYDGIQIINNCCSHCLSLGAEKFYWKDIQNIPKLPRNLNCNCMYSCIQK